MSSFYTSLSGLNAAQLDLNTTSNNIANAGTTGFKSSRAEFGDLISSSAFSSQTANIGQGTRLKSISQEFSQGSTATTSRALDLMVGGEGFFTTKSATTGAVSFTRDGAFSVNGDNNVVDSSGNELQVLPVDQFGNTIATGSAGTVGLHISQSHGTPIGTTSVTDTVSLPGDASVPATTTFSPTDATSYNYASSTTVYDTSGNAIPATSYFVRNAAAAGATDTTWSVHTYVGDQQIFPSGTSTAATLTFDNTTGALSTTPSTIAFGSVTPTGAAAPVTLSINYAGSQQGNVAFAAAADQNGNSVGKLNNITVGDDGLVSASYSDGATIKLGKVALATFSNPAGLHQQGNTTWTATASSGAADIGAADIDGRGKITSGALELSNVDLTSQLVDLISAQRNFQANAKAIDTDKQMLSSILNLQ